MPFAIAALVALLLSTAALDRGSSIDPHGAHAAAPGASADAGIRIDPEG